ncbi:MAG: adenosylcobalamin-dependent ribonucleoside-diphosphate reductase [Phycisphaerales bacterium]|nr:adenosylcobalamin-dependent ribonucleoside-diphosphate reductase [Phycisphaerales bacterium]
MKISRRFTSKDMDVYSTTEWATRSSKIKNPDGSVVFAMDDAQIPKNWSQLATDIVVSKYFRKAGVPQIAADGTATTGPERSVRQVIHRLAGCWRHWGESQGYFETPEDSQAFYDEIAFMLLHQMAAPNSPQWFNTGLAWAYGINGPAQGHWIADHHTGAVELAPDSYTHPQPHACFIQSIRDDLVNEGGIMDLWVREARLFKYGSGTGTNFSSLRANDECLSGGGKSSGLMSFLRIGDRAAGAIKSGGTTRRAAKMVCLNVDHPDIEAFVNWKVREEIKVAALVEGMKCLNEKQRGVADRLGLKLDYDFNGESYYTVSGQNSNNSVRLSDAFMDAVNTDGTWDLIRRTDGETAKTINARDLWGQITEAAWHCADPGVQFDSTINAWHTCPVGGRINASNPCSEYMFLDNTACNLASINLLKFYDSRTRNFDLLGYEHAISLWTVVLEISVMMASFPSKEIAELSWKYRTLGLGYANLGAMLMQAGTPYDSAEGRNICGVLSAILTGRSYATSALLAAEHGAFEGFDENREHMLRVIRNHRRAAQGVARESDNYESLRARPVAIDHLLFANNRINLANADELLVGATTAWDDALALGEQFGFRNAQVTVIAPTGTIGLLMDCDTTGVEPDFALTKFKKLAGGGHFKIANQSLRPALVALGYQPKETDAIVEFVMGSLNLDAVLSSADGLETATTTTLRAFLLANGFTNEELITVENGLPTVFELPFAFTAWSIPAQVFAAIGVDAESARADTRFNGLRAMGLTARQIEALNKTICGTHTVEGAPFLLAEHLAVFDCANRCGTLGTRFIKPKGHIHMMAAAQPFISGAISKTVNLPNEATIEEMGDCYQLSWELGLKANALYRDGCKLSQPLSTKSDSADHAEPEDLEGLADADESRATVPTVVFEPRIVEVERIVERVVERVIERPMRRRLQDTRQSITHKFNVGGHEGYLIVGLYEDGRPGELFITMAKEGSTIGGLMDSLGTAISVALQYGVPVESLVTKFAHQRFEPMGMTTNRDIPMAKSLVDYIFRWFGMQFLEGYRDANAPKRISASGEYLPSMDDSMRTAPATTPSTKESSEWSGTRISTTVDFQSRTTEVERIADPSTPPRIVKFPDVAESKNPASSVTPIIAEHGEFRTLGNPMHSAADQANAQMMGDAPACDGCGSITVRNGTCYRCWNCGHSMGCS